MSSLRGIRSSAVLAFVLLALVAAPPLRGQQSGDGLAGIWTTESGEMDIEFFECGDEFCARIAALKDDAGGVRRDKKNPDPNLRDRPLIGLQIISGLTYDVEDRWSGGTMYAPEKGMRVQVTLQLTGRDESRCP